MSDVPATVAELEALIDGLRKFNREAVDDHVATLSALHRDPLAAESLAYEFMVALEGVRLVRDMNVSATEYRHYKRVAFAALRRLAEP